MTYRFVPLVLRGTVLAGCIASTISTSSAQSNLEDLGPKVFTGDAQAASVMPIEIAKKIIAEVLGTDWADDPRTRKDTMCEAPYEGLDTLIQQPISESMYDQIIPYSNYERIEFISSGGLEIGYVYFSLNGKNCFQSLGYNPSLKQLKNIATSFLALAEVERMGQFHRVKKERLSLQTANLTSDQLFEIVLDVRLKKEEGRSAIDRYIQKLKQENGTIQAVGAIQRPQNGMRFSYNTKEVSRSAHLGPMTRKIEYNIHVKGDKKVAVSTFLKAKTKNMDLTNKLNMQSQAIMFPYKSSSRIHTVMGGENQGQKIDGDSTTDYEIIAQEGEVDLFGMKRGEAWVLDLLIRQKVVSQNTSDIDVGYYRKCYYAGNNRISIQEKSYDTASVTCAEQSEVSYEVNKKWQKSSSRSITNYFISLDYGIILQSDTLTGSAKGDPDFSELKTTSFRQS